MPSPLIPLHLLHSIREGCSWSHEAKWPRFRGSPKVGVQRDSYARFPYCPKALSRGCNSPTAESEAAGLPSWGLGLNRLDVTCHSGAAPRGGTPWC